MSPRSILPDRLETERLVLRPVEEADLEFFVELHGSSDVVRYLGGDGTPRPPEVTREWLAKMRRWYAEHQLGPYAFVQREDGRLVGRGGLSVFEVERESSDPSRAPLATWGLGSAAPGVDVERVLELGYVVHPDAWGRGYAPEAARAWLRYAFEIRQEPELSSMIHADNHASIRVAEKNGLRPIGRLRRDFSETADRVHMEGREYLRFQIRREDWIARERGLAR